MDRLFPTNEAYLADLKQRREAMRPLMEGIDWTGMTRPLRDPAERAFFERMGIVPRFIETNEPPQPSVEWLARNRPKDSTESQP
jgi:hypothetical protein